MPLNLAPARIELHANWRALNGCAFGIRQRTAHGGLQVTLPQDFSFTGVDAAMGALLEEKLPAAVSAAGVRAGLAHRLLHWQGALQRQVRSPVFGPCFLAARAGAADEGSETFVAALPYHSAEVTFQALKWTATTLNTLLSRPAGAEGDAAGLRESLDELLARLRQISQGGLNNFHFLHAAYASGIPTRPMLLDTFSYGQGSRRRSLQSTITDQTSYLAIQIAHSKARTSHILRLHGLPVPAHSQATSEKQAVEIATALGYPVVVKPDDEEQGRGVEAGLRSDVSVAEAWLAASKLSKTVLVEKHCEGLDYRLTVFGGKVVKILLRRPGGVTGDGVQTIAQLVGALQQTPRFVEAFRHSGKMLLDLDEEALRTLEDQRRHLEDIPAASEFVALRRKCNLSAGGIQALVDVGEAHPDNLDLAVRATHAVGLDFSGVDLLMDDISKSWLETGAAIIEINSKPQIGIRLAPEVYARALAEVMQGDGRIPVHLFLCATPADVPSSEDALEFAASKQCNGVSSPHGVWIDGRRLTGDAMTGFAAAEAVLLNDAATAACCVMTAREVIENGLPADRFAGVTVRAPKSLDGRDNAVLQMALAMVGPRAA